MIARLPSIGPRLGFLRSLSLITLALWQLSPCAHGYWRLVWNDEFNDSALDPNKWTFDTGNGFYSGGVFVSGWGNNELEYYTSRPQNVTVSNGVVHIIARKESYQKFNYTSARLKTAGKFSKKYGRFEFRAKLPQGLGFWPALWLLPQNWKYGDWPQSGEIDVMESKGGDTSSIQGSVHYGSVSAPVKSSWFYRFTGSDTTKFHIYAMEWTTNSIKMFVDGRLYGTATGWYTAGGNYPAPYDQPFHLMMNVAVGGDYVGNPSTNTINANTVFPGEMQVDYVRVYDYSPDPVSELEFTQAIRSGDELLLGGSNGPPKALYYLLESNDGFPSMFYWRRSATNQFDSRGGFSQRTPISSDSGFYRLQVP